MLKMAHNRNPTGRWWIKGDGCDILKGLRESIEKDWSGDIDMNDGLVKHHHRKYLSRLAKAATLQCQIPPPKTLYGKVTTHKADFEKDLSILESGNFLQFYFKLNY